jgi:type I restriction enzyme, S subunit
MIPSGWREAKIREVAKIDVGRDLVEERFAKTISNTHRFPIYSNTVEQHGHYGFYDFPEYSAESVTVVGRGIGLGTAFARKTPFGAIGRLLVLSPKDDSFDVGYLADYLNHGFEIHYESGGIPQLPGKTLGNYSILLPPLPEQRRIAEILSTWDRAIETVEAMIANAVAQKKALMQSLLTAKHRLPGFSGEWAELSLRDLATIHYGSSPKGIAVKGGKFRIIGTGGIVGTTNEVVCRSSAIIIGRKGTIDKPQLIKGGFWAIDTTYFCLPKQNIDLWWLFEQVRCFDFKALNEASGVPSLSRETLYAVRLLVPPIEEQSAIGELLSEAESFECALQSQLTALRQEKTALMQQLLTGKRRVTIAEMDEV